LRSNRWHQANPHSLASINQTNTRNFKGIQLQIPYSETIHEGQQRQDIVFIQSSFVLTRAPKYVTYSTSIIEISRSLTIQDINSIQIALRSLHLRATFVNIAYGFLTGCWSIMVLSTGYSNNIYIYIYILDIEMNEYIHIRKLKVHAQALEAPSQIHCNDTKLFSQSKIWSISILFLLYIRLQQVSKDVLCMHPSAFHA
jgi:hypothetical protein